MSMTYIQHPGRVLTAGAGFSHVMALALDPRTKYRDGVIRCITSRAGDLTVKGYVDRSVLHKVKSDSLEKFSIGEQLKISKQAEVVAKLAGSRFDFIGLEDPDIWIDETTGLLHLYFTLPLKDLISHHTVPPLGHAYGKDLDRLEMTEPVLMADTMGRAKELSIAPVNKHGFRYNLVESNKREQDGDYSVVRVALAENMGHDWHFGAMAYHPAEHRTPWIGGHASPGPLLPKSFIDLGGGKVLGLMNGREADQTVNGQIHYGIFSVGLFIYDYENGIIDWVSPEPLIRDSEAKTITFASQFVETGKGEGILYAHVDDSFVRAYTLSAAELRRILPI